MSEEKKEEHQGVTADMEQEESEEILLTKPQVLPPEQVHVESITVSEPRQKLLPQTEQEVLKVVPMKPEWQDMYVDYTVLLKEVAALQRRAQSIMSLMTGTIERDLEDYDHVIQIDEQGKNVLVLKQEKK